MSRETRKYFFDDEKFANFWVVKILEKLRRVEKSWLEKIIWKFNNFQLNLNWDDVIFNQEDKFLTKKTKLTKKHQIYLNFNKIILTKITKKFLPKKVKKNSNKSFTLTWVISSSPSPHLIPYSSAIIKCEFVRM